MYIIILYHVDLPPSSRIFDKNHEFLGFEFTLSIILITEGQGYRQKGTESLGWA